MDNGNVQTVSGDRDVNQKREDYLSWSDYVDFDLEEGTCEFNCYFLN
jgi:hypothetical protein